MACVKARATGRGDAPGAVRLVDRAGRTLKQTPVRRVRGRAESAAGQGRRAVITLAADLPRPD